jgi:hypothetical protein
MSKKLASEQAIRLAVSKLQNVDLIKRCENLGLPVPDENGTINFHAFSKNWELRSGDFQLANAETKAPAKATDRILVLHYLKCDLPVPETDTFISFRDLPGGQFYWQSFRSRTVQLLVDKFQNNLDRLSHSLNRFDWKPVKYGDFGARIHAIGRLDITLIYRKGDEEFPPTGDLLFTDNIKRVYETEDVAVLGSRVCLGLL